MSTGAPSPGAPAGEGPGRPEEAPRGAGRWAKLGAGLLLAAWAASAAADVRQLQRLYVADQPDGARLVFEFSAAPEYRLVRWVEPNRLRLDFTGTRLAAPVRQPPASHPFLGRIEVAEKPGQALHFSVVLKRKVGHRAFLARGGNRSRLVIELAGAGRGAESPAAAGKPPPRPRAMPQGLGTRVVAIDAGHGGKDTGAIGPGGHREKDIVLAIARRLNGMLRAEPGLRPVMVRQDDRFVPLRARLAIARDAKANLFVSLHADADPSGRVRGMSVYTLSRPTGRLNREVGATAPADPYWWAARADSERAAAAILREARKSFPIRHHQVQKARFMVLKCPGIPSVLVETGFISHPEGERTLASPARQERIARALFYGIRRFFAKPARSAPVERLAAAPDQVRR